MASPSFVAPKTDAKAASRSGMPVPSRANTPPGQSLASEPENKAGWACPLTRIVPNPACQSTASDIADGTSDVGDGTSDVADGTSDVADGKRRGEECSRYIPPLSAIAYQQPG